ncbi:MAG TPA: hypothetical protein VEI02_10775 [Planctomycetota bacterium]|nr:hypothetical protein [Planctomycetota bacterium]
MTRHQLRDPAAARRRRLAKVLFAVAIPLFAGCREARDATYRATEEGLEIEIADAPPGRRLLVFVGPPTGPHAVVSKAAITTVAADSLAEKATPVAVGTVEASGVARVLAPWQRFPADGLCIQPILVDTSEPGGWKMDVYRCGVVRGRGPTASVVPHLEALAWSAHALTAFAVAVVLAALLALPRLEHRRRLPRRAGLAIVALAAIALAFDRGVERVDPSRHVGAGGLAVGDGVWRLRMLPSLSTPGPYGVRAPLGGPFPLIPDPLRWPGADAATDAASVEGVAAMARAIRASTPASASIVLAGPLHGGLPGHTSQQIAVRIAPRKVLVAAEDQDPFALAPSAPDTYVLQLRPATAPPTARRIFHNGVGSLWRLRETP